MHIWRTENVFVFYNEKSVFEVFLAPQFREPLTQAYTRVVDAVYHTPRNLRESNTSSISPEQMSSYAQLNSFLQRFFSADEKTREYDVIPRPVSYTMFRVPPSPEERSILYAEPNCSLKIGVFGRSEWLVALMDILFLSTLPNKCYYFNDIGISKVNLQIDLWIAFLLIWIVWTGFKTGRPQNFLSL